MLFDQKYVSTYLFIYMYHQEAELYCLYIVYVFWKNVPRSTLLSQSLVYMFYIYSVSGPSEANHTQNVLLKQR